MSAVWFCGSLIGYRLKTFHLQDLDFGISVYFSYYLYEFTCRLHLKDCLNNPSIEGEWTRVFIFTPFIYRIWPLCVKYWPKWRVRQYKQTVCVDDLFKISRFQIFLVGISRVFVQMRLFTPKYRYSIYDIFLCMNSLSINVKHYKTLRRHKYVKKSASK